MGLVPDDLVSRASKPIDLWLLFIYKLKLEMKKIKIRSRNHCNDKNGENSSVILSFCD